jgi:putative SOS response-associated peptidase YedK
MCGRFTLTKPKKVSESFHVPDVPTVPVRYNVAPTQDIPIVRQAAHGRERVLARWGL